jgi:hypothetical protein
MMRPAGGTASAVRDERAGQQRGFRRIWTSGFEDEAEGGRFADGESYLAAFSQQLGKPVSRQQWIDARATAMNHWPVMHDLVGGLAGHTGLRCSPTTARLTQSAFAELAPHTAACLGPTSLLLLPVRHQETFARPSSGQSHAAWRPRQKPACSSTTSRAMSPGARQDRHDRTAVCRCRNPASRSQPA